MLIRSDSRVLRVLLILARVLPIWAERCRVGNDYTTYTRVTLRLR